MTAFPFSRSSVTIAFARAFLTGISSVPNTCTSIAAISSSSVPAAIASPSIGYCAANSSIVTSRATRCTFCDQNTFITPTPPSCRVWLTNSASSSFSRISPSSSQRMKCVAKVAFPKLSIPTGCALMFAPDSPTRSVATASAISSSTTATFKSLAPSHGKGFFVQ